MNRKRILKSFQIEALPVINAYIKNCGLSGIFDQFVSSGSGMKIPYSTMLLSLLRNIILSGFPLYQLGGRAATFKCNPVRLSRRLRSAGTPYCSGACAKRREWAFDTNAPTSLKFLYIKLMRAYARNPILLLGRMY